MQEYTVNIGGVEHTVMAENDEDAKRHGYTVKAKTPANKQATPQNKEAAGDDTGTAAPARKRH